jgi:DNA-binding winged helix-turn-helix (wHTH) protein
MQHSMSAQPRTPRSSNNPKAVLALPPLPMPGAPEARRHKRDFVFGRREVSVARREVLVDGVQHTLQPRPFDVLVHLIEHRDRVVSTDELLDHIWKDEFVQPGSLAAAIVRIRKALLDSGRDACAIIRTHQGIGYRFAVGLDDDAATNAIAHID